MWRLTGWVPLFLMALCAAAAAATTIDASAFGDCAENTSIGRVDAFVGSASTGSAVGELAATSFDTPKGLTVAALADEPYFLVASEGTNQVAKLAPPLVSLRLSSVATYALVPVGFGNDAVYYAEHAQHTVMAVNPATGATSTLAGTAGSAGGSTLSW